MERRKKMVGIGKRMALALEVLSAGGYFRKALEAGYGFRGEKFKYRLRTKEGRVVPGVGAKACIELERKGVIRWRPCEKSSVWPEEWELVPEALEKIETEGL